MTTTIRTQPTKRTLLTLIALCPWMAGCSLAAKPDTPAAIAQRRFRGIGCVLVVDAVPGAEMREVVFDDDRGVQIYAKSLVSRRTREIMGLGGTRVPLTVRAVWRQGAGWDNVKKVWSEGKIVGDYTVLVAERIPDVLLHDIRAHGGALRLKFRLKPDGVLFGWDIERPGGGISKFDMPGGDFTETRY